MRTFAASAALVMLMQSYQPARAHKSWGNGEPIPEWVLKSCCGAADAHHLSPDQVHRVEGGYRIDGYPRMIPDFQTTPSEDGEYWAFYSEYRDADGVRNFTSVYCFFAPAAG